MNLYIDLLKAAKARIAPVPSVKTPEPEGQGKKLERCQYGGGIECVKHGGDGAKSHFTGYRHSRVNTPRSIHELATKERNDATQSILESKHQPETINRSLVIARGVLKHLNQYQEDSFKALGKEDQLKELRAATHTDDLVDMLFSHDKIDRQTSQVLSRSLEETSRRLTNWIVESELDRKPPGKKGTVAKLKEKAYQATVTAKMKVGHTTVDITKDDQIEKLLSDAIGDTDVNKLLDAWDVRGDDFMAIITEVKVYEDKIRVDGELLTSEGDSMGVFEREASLDENGILKIYHKLLDIGEDYQGNHAGSKLIRHAVKQYLELGVVNLDTHPAWVGKYTWPRMGFNWPKEGEEYIREAMPEYITKETGMPLNIAKKIVNQHSSRAWDIARIDVGGEKVGKEFLLDDNYGGELWSRCDAHIELKKDNPAFQHMMKYLGMENVNVKN